VNLDDDAFTSERFKPGSSGESDLYRALFDGMQLSPQKDLFGRS
jgi:hypothetical protein